MSRWANREVGRLADLGQIDRRDRGQLERDLEPTSAGYGLAIRVPFGPGGWVLAPRLQSGESACIWFTASVWVN